MTEAEWLSGDCPSLLFEFAAEKAADRKARLFACACCRLIPEFMESEPDRLGLELTERDVDGFGDDDALCRLDEQWDIRWYRKDGWDAVLRAMGTYFDVSEMRAAESRPDFGASGDRRYRRDVTLASILRDIFGNPFRPVAFDPGWRTEAVVGLAAGIYADRAFDRLPVLADALEDAGCADADLLTHCRGPGPHVRGCWAVDLVLEKC